MAPDALDRFREWIGRTEEREDVVTAGPLVALSALLDRDDPRPKDGDAAPPLAHWLYFLPSYRGSEAGPDGHEARGAFLPPVPLPRRMWAGSRLEFLRPLAVGARVKRRSRIADVVPKQGRSGALVFVTVRHEVSDANGLVLSDEHDIVYRGGSAGGGEPRAAPAQARWPAPGGCDAPSPLPQGSSFSQSRSTRWKLVMQISCTGLSRLSLNADECMPR